MEDEAGNTDKAPSTEARACLALWAVITSRTLHELLAYRPTYGECLEAAAAYSRDASGFRGILCPDTAFEDAVCILGMPEGAARDDMEHEAYGRFHAIQEEESLRQPPTPVAVDLGDPEERVPYVLVPMA